MWGRSRPTSPAEGPPPPTTAAAAAAAATNDDELADTLSPLAPPQGGSSTAPARGPSRSLEARSAAPAAAARGRPDRLADQQEAAALRLEDLEDEEGGGAGGGADDDGGDEGAPPAAPGPAAPSSSVYDDAVPGDIEAGLDDDGRVPSAAAAAVRQRKTAAATAAAAGAAAAASTTSSSAKRHRHFLRYRREMGGGDDSGNGSNNNTNTNNAVLLDKDEEAFRAALKRHHASDAHEAVLARVQVRRLAAAWLRDSGWGRRLMIFDCFLSVASVVLYIASTYAIPPPSSTAAAASGEAELMSTDPTARGFLYADFGLSVFFAAHWALRFWVTEERLPFVFSFGTLIDALTTLPTFISIALTIWVPRADGTVPAFAFLRVFRVLRVVRLFTITRHDSPTALASEVSRAAALLGFTFVTFIVLAATLFYEIERRDPESENKDLSFGEALYWGCVTLTTVGYGDISPNTGLTQALTVVMLGVSFVTLPFLTTKLVDALGATSVYQRGSYKGPGCFGTAPHVVVTGSLDGDSVGNFTSELYHSDKGFAEVRTVFLSPQPPSLAVKQALASGENNKLLYLQGTPFRPVDLQRAAVATADAIFVIVDRAAADPAAADRRAVMTLLSIGTHLQEAAVAAADEWRRSAWRRRWLLACLPRCVRPAGGGGGAVPPRTHVPEIFVQLLLPESRHMLNRVMRGLHDRSRLGALAAADLHEAAAAAAARKQHRFRRRLLRRSTSGHHGGQQAQSDGSIRRGVAYYNQRPVDAARAGAGAGGAATAAAAAATSSEDDDEDDGLLTPTPNMPAPPSQAQRAAAILRAQRDLGQAEPSSSDDSSSDSSGSEADEAGAGAGGGGPARSLSTRIMREQARRARRRVAKEQQRLLSKEYARELERARAPPGGAGRSSGATAATAFAAPSPTPLRAGDYDPHHPPPDLHPIDSGAFAARQYRSAQANTAANLGGTYGAQASAGAAANYGFGDDDVGTLVGANFWAAMAAGLRIIVFGELRNALLSHSLLCPGAITLLCNAATTAGEAPTRESRPDLPGWLIDYARGAGHELYEAGVFPRALHGCLYEEAAAFVYDHCGAVLLALDRIVGAEAPAEEGEGVGGRAAGGAAGGGAAAAAAAAASPDEQPHHLRSTSVEGAAPREPVSFLQVAPFGAVIDAGTCGYLLAQDVKAVAAVVEARERDVAEWRRRRAAERASAAQAQARAQQARQAGAPPPPPTAAAAATTATVFSPARPIGRPSMSFVERHRSMAALAAARSGGSVVGGGVGSGSFSRRQHQQQQFHRQGSGPGASPQQQPHNPHHSPHHRPLSSHGGARRRLEPREHRRAYNTHEALIPATLLRSASRDARLAARAYMARHYLLRHEGPQRAAAAPLAPAPSLQAAMLAADGGAQQQQPQLTQRRSLTSRAPIGWGWSQGGTGGGLGDNASEASGGAGGPGATATATTTTTTTTTATTAVGALPPPNLFSRAPEAAERGEDAEQSAARLDAVRDAALISRMVLDRVPFSGHVLIVGTPSSLGSLLTLIAPLRSRVLTRARPIVVLSHERPRADTLWADVARFQDVYVIVLNSGEGATSEVRGGAASGDGGGGGGGGSGPTAGGAETAGAMPPAAGVTYGGAGGLFAGGVGSGSMSSAGNIVSADDLLRANAEGATHALLLAGAGAGGETASAVASAAAAAVAAGADEEEALLEAHMLYDSSVLGAYQALRALNPAMRIVTELVWAGYAAFLRPVHPVAGLPAGLRPEELAPAYLSGTVLMPRSLDALMVMAFTNRRSDALLQRLLSAWHAGGGGREAARLVQRLRRWRTLKAAHALAAATAAAEAGGIGPGEAAAAAAAIGGGGGGGVAADDLARAPSAASGEQLPSFVGGGAGEDGGGPGPGPGSARFAPAAFQAAVDGGAGGDGASDAPSSSRRRAAAAAAQAAGGASRSSRTSHSGSGECPTLVQVALSEQLEGCTYREFFQHMVSDRRMLPLGLFRAVSQRGQRFSCAITNPPEDTPLLAADRAFVVFDVAGCRSGLPEDVLWF